MKTQSEIDSEREEKARQAQPDELKASDFFPPGEGWNQDGSERTDLASPQHKLPDADVKRH